MAVATATFTANLYPAGFDNTQRSVVARGGGLVPLGNGVINGITFVGASPSYVQGGIRINFANLESYKVSPTNLTPEWMEIQSLSGSGYSYALNLGGAQITNLALTTNVVTVTAHNNLAAGDVVTLSGLTVNTGLNGIPLTVLASGLSATAFTANLTHANIASAAETGYAIPTTYANGLAYQGNLQIFQSGGAAARLRSREPAAPRSRPESGRYASAIKT